MVARELPAAATSTGRPCKCSTRRVRARAFVASLTLDPNTAWFNGQPEFSKIGDGFNSVIVSV